MKGCRPFTERESAWIVDYFSGSTALRDKTLFILGCTTGFRISELLSLKVKNVYQHNKLVDRVQVDRQYMKKKVESRSVILHAVGKKAINELLREMKQRGTFDPNHFLFHAQGAPWRAINRRHAWRILTGAYAALGITGKLGTHAMRKIFANKVYDSLNGDLVRTQEALGHRKIDTTVKYLQFKREEVDTAIQSLDFSFGV